VARFARSWAGRKARMTEPGRTPHTSEPAEGDDAPGRQVDERTPHPQDPAEGKDVPGGADQPETD
jgi:hypothetical protein